MRIGIDARFLTHPQPGGFKTYTERLVSALSDVDTANQYVLYVDRPPAAGAAIPTAPNMRVQVVPGTMPMIGMPWREQVGIAVQVRRDHLDLFHAPCLTAPLYAPCPLVVTIHDTIWMAPERFGRNSGKGKRSLMERYYQVVPHMSARRAAAIITVSRDARNAIIGELKIPADRVFVTYEAASPLYRRLPQVDLVNATRRRYGLSDHFILALGSADPRKNIGTLLEAYALLSEEQRARCELAIVWTHPLLADSIIATARSLRIEGRLRFLHRVPNDDLVALYNAAALFVFPSRYEGFGLPLLEAMACGTPVVAANNSSIPEVVGEAALLAQAESAPEIARQMGRVLSDIDLSRRLSADGMRRAAEFSWQRCARETIVVYQNTYTNGIGVGNARVV